MGNFEEISFGGVTISGCVVPTQICRRQKYFDAGDVAFSARTARLGLLERVAIRKRKMLWFGRTQSVLYTDTQNVLWQEADLVDLATAKAIVAETKQKVESN